MSLRISREKVCRAWLAKAMLPYSVIDALMDIYISPENLYESFMKDKKHFADGKLPERVCHTLSESSGTENMNRLASIMEKHDIDIMTCSDTEYPFLLKQIADMPSFLFYCGSAEALSYERISFVGTRSPTAKARIATERITEHLSANGVSVVSGLAYGIDAAAHSGCIRGDSPTIAVLGCGLDLNYPAENESLRKKIIDKGGIVVSEYFPGEKPVGWHFPYRNRIISGLSKATVLMEARIRSGSMTTVRHAVNQGRDVYAWPNDPDSIYSEAAHELLREGARYFLTAEDLLEDLGIRPASPNTRSAGMADNTEKLTPSQIKIMKVIEQGECGFDEIVIKTNIPPAEAVSELTMLQIMCKITVLPGKRYALSLIK